MKLKVELRSIGYPGILFAGFIALAGCGGNTGIQIVSATYGASCGAPAGNATADLKDKCEGQDACDYKVDVTVIGDPKKGCAKEFEATWKCGSNPELHAAKLPGEAGFGKHVQLTCPASK